MLKSSLCDYGDEYKLVKGTMSIEQVKALAAPDNDGKEVLFKNCALFTDSISEIKNIQIDNAKEIDVSMSLYNLRIQ